MIAQSKTAKWVYFTEKGNENCRAIRAKTKYLIALDKMV